MKKLIIDLDDVLALDGFLNTINNYFNTNYTYEDSNNYYLDELLTKEQQIDFKNHLKETDLYKCAKVAPYSKEVLKELNNKYNIYICSSLYSELDNTLIPDLVPKKCEFLETNYPFLNSKNFVFLTEKSMLEADVRIDDRIDNLKGEGIKLLYTAYHNKNIPDEELKEQGIERVNNWLEIKNKLI